MYAKDAVNSQIGLRQFGIPRLHVGSRLLADAYAGDGSLLLRAGLRVDSEWNLQRLLMPDVRFGDDRSDAMPIDLANEAGVGLDPARELNVKTYGESVNRACSVKAEVVQDVAEVFGRIQSVGTVPAQSARRAVAALIEDMVQDPRALVSLAQLKNTDSYTFTHSVNVSILSIYLAIQCGLISQVEAIGTAALLHDAGKAKIPVCILNKPDALTPGETALMRDHPRLGFHIVNASGEFEPAVPAAVLDHHEKMNGCGYPSRKNGAMIAHYARIISIADVYDALTTDRPYRKAMDPRTALVLMTENMASNFDGSYLNRFTAVLGYYPVGSRVILSDGREAMVVRNHPSDALRPAVSFDGADAESAVDLREEKDLFVQGFAGEEEPPTAMAA